MRSTAVAALILVVSTAMPTEASDRVLDEILNTIHLAAHTPDRESEAFFETSDEAPIGQVFRTSGDAEYVHRIAIWQAFWHETWDPDEMLTMTLWDSPAREQVIGRASIPYARRMWEGAIPMFAVEARVQPDHDYYFELTVQRKPMRPAEVPREWLLAKSRPSIADGDALVGGIGQAKSDYAAGQMYVDSEPQEGDLWFQVHERRKRSRDAIYQRAFDLFNLEHPELKNLAAAVEAKQWDRAVTELVRHFENRSDIMKPKDRGPGFDPDFDAYLSDLAAAHIVPVPTDGSWVDLGPRWNHYSWWPQRGGVGLTRSGLRKPLSLGYAHTRNPKYARAFNQMLYYFFVDCPSPVLADVYPEEGTIPASLPSGLAGGSMWSALSIGARMQHGFYYYNIFYNSPQFTEDIRAAWIINLGEMADVLERMRGSGNWETQMADALFQFGLDYPEYKRSRAWVQRGMSKLIDNALSTVHDDGVLHEPTIGYHQLVLNRYSNFLKQTRQMDLEIPQQFVKRTRQMFEFLMYSVRPDGTLPIWGDANYPSRPTLLERGAELFERDDMRFALTAGEEGQPPESTSVGYPHGGFYYMRDGWSRDANYMGIRAGHFGSHGHHDALSVVVSALGKTVLIDPGVHTYGTPEARELQSSISHNTVTVDQANTSSANVIAWQTGAHFDYFLGENTGYRSLNDVRHCREIVFLKAVDHWPALWLIVDRLTGPGEHEATLRYRFAPLTVESKPEAGKVWTTGDKNLMIQAAGPAELSCSLEEGIAVFGDLTNVPVATWSANQALPITIASALLPYQGQSVPESTLSIKRRSEDAGQSGQILWLETDTFAVAMLTRKPADSSQSVEAVTVELPTGQAVKLDGQMIVLRFSRAGEEYQLKAFHGLQIKSASYAGRALVDADEKVEVIDRLLNK